MKSPSLAERSRLPVKLVINGCGLFSAFELSQVDDSRDCGAGSGGGVSEGGGEGGVDGSILGLTGGSGGGGTETSSLGITGGGGSESSSLGVIGGGGGRGGVVGTICEMEGGGGGFKTTTGLSVVSLRGHFSSELSSLSASVFTLVRTSFMGVVLSSAGLRADSFLGLFAVGSRTTVRGGSFASDLLFRLTCPCLLFSSLTGYGGL